MLPRKVLYISGTLGLGHVIRDLAIVRELRRKIPDLEFYWLAAQPASSVLEQSGEKLLPEAVSYASETDFAENAASGSRLNLLKYLMNARGGWARNVEIFKKIVSREQFDLVIADEAFEILLAREDSPTTAQIPFVMFYDFVGLDAMTSSPLEKLGIYMWNRTWCKDDQKADDPNLLQIFIGELQDVPDKSFGFLLPNRREYAGRKYQFIGYVLGFTTQDYLDKGRVRAELGYGDEPLVLCAIGGTSVGKELLELCGQAYPLVREKIPNLHMILVCGPRLSVDTLSVPSGVKIAGYLPELFKHFAASDLVITQGGGTTTLELTALRRPFIYFPLEEHFEQQITVAGRLERHKAGIRMALSRTTPQSLAESITANLGAQVAYGPIPFDGAQKAAQMIGDFLALRQG